MHYISTRGYHVPQKFSEILLSGLAPDGGLYMPIEYPKITNSELSCWRNISYASLAFEILKKFATDIPHNDLEALVRKTYTAEIYRNVRQGEDSRDITPMRTFEEDGDNKLILQSLSNGPTLAFKDMAMQLLGNLFEYTLSKKNGELNILGATSGDTGSAAEYAMLGKKGISVFMLSPHKKMSAFQAAQMFSIKDKNIFNIAIEGVFDDCQDIVKAVSNDHIFKDSQKIGTVNSINWARIVAQVVYYFRGYLSATTENNQKVSFTVPSGNFGNICAGHIARMMGLPIDKLVVATNENDVLDEFFRTGTYRVRRSSDTYHTSSPSMDISKASNFERFIYDLLDRDNNRVNALFDKLEATGTFCLSGKQGSDGDEFKKVISQFGFKSGKSNHQERLSTIREIKKLYGIIVDTHTADGIKVAREHISPGIPMIILETALPVKFNETIYEALGYYAKPPIGFKDIESLPQSFEVMAADVSGIKKFITNQGCN
jgi:threonine synthase